MKKIVFFILILQAYLSNGQVGIGTVSPDNSAILDVTSTTKGILFPRTDTSSVTLSGASSTGLIIYRMTDNKFYYYNGTKWTALLTEAEGWLIDGNASTDANTNFLGTSDSIDLVFKTNNIEKFRINADHSITARTYQVQLYNPASAGSASSRLLIEGGPGSTNNSEAIIRLKPFGNWASVIEYGLPGSILDRNALSFYSYATSSTVMQLATDGRFVIGGHSARGKLEVRDTDNNTDFVVSETGRVGIGTAAPGGAFHVANDVNGGDSSFVITESGNIGIGLNVPDYKFHIDTPADTNTFIVNDSDGRVGFHTNSLNSTVNIGGSLSLPITSKTSNYTADSTDYTILVDASGGVVTITLPTSVGNSGRVYIVKKMDTTNNVTVLANGSETIDGSGTFTLMTQYQRIIIQSDGTNWVRID